LGFPEFGRPVPDRGEGRVARMFGVSPGFYCSLMTRCYEPPGGMSAWDIFGGHGYQNYGCIKFNRRQR